MTEAQYVGKPQLYPREPPLFSSSQKSLHADMPDGRGSAPLKRKWILKLRRRLPERSLLGHKKIPNTSLPGLIKWSPLTIIVNSWPPIMKGSLWTQASRCDFALLCNSK